MKRSRFGALLLVGLLAAGLFSGWLIHRWHDPISEQIREASRLATAGNWEDAQDLTAQAKSRWEHYWHISAAISDHRPMEEVDALFEELEVYGQFRDEVNYAAACSRIAGKLQGISGDNDLKWWNVF